MTNTQSGVAYPQNGAASDERTSGAPSPGLSGGRMVDRLDQKLVNALTVLGFGVPVIGYFWFVDRYSVNVVVGDQWDLISMIKQSYVHYFDWGPMWAQHNENRIFFPNMVAVFLAHTAHFNVRAEVYLGALMLVVSMAFILWAHKRRSPSTPWLYYCPVVFLGFSVVQYGNSIWAFQLAWYMVLLSLAATILLLDRVILTRITFVAALVVAIIGSFSSLQGLLIWPTGLVLLYFRRRSLAQIAVWVGAAIASVITYFHGYKSTTPDSHFALDHPLMALKFFLLSIGDVVGKPIADGVSDYQDTLIMVFGLIIVVLVVGTLLICGLRRDERSASPVGIALVVYGVMFAITITQGRIFFGYAAAGFSRYTTFDLLVLVGVYLALLGRRGSHAVDSDQLIDGPTDTPASSGRWSLRPVREWLGRAALPGIRVAVLVAIAIQIPFGLYNGLQGARVNHAQFAQAATVLRNINHTSNGELVSSLLVFKSAPFLREQALTLEEHHLSVFVNG